jgi:hypothetical protein
MARPMPGPRIFMLAVEALKGLEDLVQVLLVKADSVVFHKDAPCPIRIVNSGLRA